MLKYLLPVFSLFLSLHSCTISGEQEEQLNNSLAQFILANNENRSLEYTALTHPAAVRYYQSAGDSAFVQHFRPTENRSFLDNPTYLEMRSEGRDIQRKYSLNSNGYDGLYEEETIIFALSNDSGDNWFFLTKADYFNQHIHGFKRLFK